MALGRAEQASRIPRGSLNMQGNCGEIISKCALDCGEGKTKTFCTFHTKSWDNLSDGHLLYCAVISCGDPWNGSFQFASSRAPFESIFLVVNFWVALVFTDGRAKVSTAVAARAVMEGDCSCMNTSQELVKRCAWNYNFYALKNHEKVHKTNLKWFWLLASLSCKLFAGIEVQISPKSTESLTLNLKTSLLKVKSLPD